MISETTLHKISRMLKSAGCKEVFLFGSQLTGRAGSGSDIDIGVKGLSPQKFLSVYRRLDEEMRERIDLVDFDEQRAFFDLLSGIGEIRQIG